MYFKHPKIQFLPLMSFTHPACLIKLHFEALSSILTTLLNSIFSPYSCFTKIKNIFGVTKQSASVPVRSYQIFNKIIRLIRVEQNKTVHIHFANDAGQMRP